MKLIKNKKIRLAIIYFIPVFLIFSGFAAFILYLYNNQISQFDNIISDIVFEELSQFDDLAYEDIDQIITDQDWETLSMQDIDQKLISNNLSPIGDPNDPTYPLTPEEIRSQPIIWDQFSTFNLEDPCLNDTQCLQQEIQNLPYLSLEAINEIEEKIFQATLLRTIAILFLITFIFGLAAYFLAKKSLHPLEEALEKQKRFVSDSSHEIKTPLTLLKSEAEIILRDKDTTPQEYREFAEHIIKNINRLDELTKNLLQLCQLENQNHKIHTEKIPLLQTINEITNTFQKKLTAKKLQLKITIKHTSKINCHPQLFSQLINILIDNAIKYSTNNSTITLKHHSTNKQSILSITNQGQAIPQSELKHIFERFYRVSKDRNQKGYGLGLAIAKDIIRLHNGQITIQNTAKNHIQVQLSLPKTP